jgi:serine/threonine protein kinase
VLEKEDIHQAAFSQWPTKLSCLSDIACAVGFMHLKGLAHCDLKCENVMVQTDGSTYHAVLGDFGSACDSLSWDSRRGPVGTVRFMAPELHTLEMARRTEAGSDGADAPKDSGQLILSPVKADVFSFAFIMWILVSDVDYHDRVTGRQVKKFALNPWNYGNGELSDLAVKEDVCNKKRPQCRERKKAWYSYYDLMDACWSQNPDERPDFDIIEEILASLGVGCDSAFRGSKDSQARSFANTVRVSSGPQTLSRNPDLVETLTNSASRWKDKFGCKWQDHLIKEVPWNTHQNLYYFRTLALAERNSWSDADVKLKGEVLAQISGSGLGKNRDVFEGDDAAWKLEKITALRDSRRCGPHTAQNARI